MIYMWCVWWHSLSVALESNEGNGKREPPCTSRMCFSIMFKHSTTNHLACMSFLHQKDLASLSWSSVSNHTWNSATPPPTPAATKCHHYCRNCITCTPLRISLCWILSEWLGHILWERFWPEKLLGSKPGHRYSYPLVITRSKARSY